MLKGSIFNIFNSGNLIEKIKTRNAMESLLIGAVLFFLPLLIIAYFSSGKIQIISIVMAFLYFILFAMSFFYLLVKDPDRLHSEEHLREIRRFSLEESKNSGPIIDSNYQTDNDRITSKVSNKTLEPDSEI